MFLNLLLVTFGTSFAVALAVAWVFSSPISNIMKRIIADSISSAWARYMQFAIMVVGVSSGVRIYELEKYVTPNRFIKDGTIVQLTSERWILELYRTIIDTLQGVAWMLFAFFAVALVAYVIVRIAETRRQPKAEKDERKSA